MEEVCESQKQCVSAKLSSPGANHFFTDGKVFNMTNLNVSAVQMHLSTVQFDPNSAESTTAVQFDDSIS